MRVLCAFTRLLEADPAEGDEGHEGELARRTRQEATLFAIPFDPAMNSSHEYLVFRPPVVHCGAAARLAILAVSQYRWTKPGAMLGVAAPFARRTGGEGVAQQRNVA